MSVYNATDGSYLGSTRNPYSYEKVEQISRDIQTPWLTLAQITDQLNLFDDESQDTLLQNLELATRMAIEDYLGMSIFPISYRVYYGSITNMGTNACLDLPEITQNNGTQLGISNITVGYYDTNTPPVFQKLTASQFFYDPTGNKLIVNGIPSEVNTVMSNPVVVTYQTAASPLAQYPVIQQAGLLLLTHFYNNRSNTTNMRMLDIPFGVDVLLRPYKSLVM